MAGCAQGVGGRPRHSGRTARRRRDGCHPRPALGAPRRAAARRRRPRHPLAQAIGRLGNWFNQELFGRPTDLPWGLRIDREHRPDGYETFATFHPTFLYEALWNLALAGLLVLYERRRPGGRPGRLFALYVGGYGLGRLWVEALRIDDATRIAGVRVNIWVSLVAIASAAVALAVLGREDRQPIQEANGPPAQVPRGG